LLQQGAAAGALSAKDRLPAWTLAVFVFSSGFSRFLFEIKRQMNVKKAIW